MSSCCSTVVVATEPGFIDTEKEGVGNGDDCSFIAWREYQTHNANDDENGQDEEMTFFGFHLFETTEEDEVFEYTINDTTTLQLKGVAEWTKSTGVAPCLGSEVLLEYLKAYPSLVQDQRVLELGAGLGLCGLAAHHLGAQHVTVTDGDTEVLKKLRANVQHNALRYAPERTIEYRQLIWGPSTSNPLTNNNGCDETYYDVVLAADCLYIPQSLPLFWETVRATLEEHHGIFVYVNVCAEYVAPEQVMYAATNYGFIWCLTEFQGKPVYTFRRRPQKKMTNKNMNPKQYLKEKASTDQSWFQ